METHVADLSTGAVFAMFQPLSVLHSKSHARKGRDLAGCEGNDGSGRGIEALLLLEHSLGGGLRLAPSVEIAVHRARGQLWARHRGAVLWLEPIRISSWDRRNSSAAAALGTHS